MPKISKQAGPTVAAGYEVVESSSTEEKEQEPVPVETEPESELHEPQQPTEEPELETAPDTEPPVVPTDTEHTYEPPRRRRR